MKNYLKRLKLKELENKIRYNYKFLDIFTDVDDSLLVETKKLEDEAICLIQETEYDEDDIF